ncbi:MAG: Flp pilus assembly protein CpaB [Planctomycetes bacterium]|nr:Flp pilus assembly protein CpaB [Planctomycetota bacterium]
MKNKLALVVAVLLGLVSLAGVHKYVKDKEAELRGDVNEVSVLVAKDTLEPGTEVTADMVEPFACPEKYVPMEAIRDSERDRKVYIGQVLHDKVKKGQYLLTKYFNPGEVRESLESRITAGMRAVTVSVDGTSGFSGLLRPGAYVDVMGTFDVEVKLIMGAQVAEENTVTKTMTILRRKVVLAVGKELGTPMEELSSPDDLSSGDEEYKTVTLEVTHQEAQELIYAQNKGRISLVLRKKNDVQETQVQPVDMEYLLKKSGVK